MKNPFKLFFVLQVPKITGSVLNDFSEVTISVKKCFKYFATTEHNMFCLMQKQARNFSSKELICEYFINSSLTCWYYWESRAASSKDISEEIRYFRRNKVFQNGHSHIRIAATAFKVLSSHVQ